MTDLTIAYVSRKNIDALFRGEWPDDVRPFFTASDLNPRYLKDDEFAAVFSNDGGSLASARKPSLLSIPSDQSRNLLAWCATYQQDFTPISQWCRIIDPKWLDDHKDLKIEASLDSFEAAWAGAIIGEVIARHGVNLTDVSLVWCLSSGTYTYARSLALWPNKTSPENVLAKIDEARSLLRAEPRRELNGLSNVWRVLSTLQNPTSKSGSSLQGAQKAILSACKEILETGSFNGANAKLLSEYCEMAGAISDIDAMNAEDRVRLIDTIMPYAETANSQRDQDSIDVISFLVGFAIGRVGAGEANLELLLPYNELLPMASVWCPTIAGLHKPIPWSSALNGLGRLVVKELNHPLHIDEAPRTDICLDELRAMINPRVNLKRLPFRPASKRIAMVEIMPGVEVAVNLKQDAIIKSHAVPTAKVTSSTAQPDLTLLAADLLKIAGKYLNNPPKQAKPQSRGNARKKSPPRQSAKKKTKTPKDKDPKLFGDA